MRAVNDADARPSASSSCKRARECAQQTIPHLAQEQREQHESSARSLLMLPIEVLELAFSKLDARSLAVISQVCRAFRARDTTSKDAHRWPERIARDMLEQRYGPEEAKRWRNYKWLERLHLEQTMTQFDSKRCEKQGFQFTSDDLGRTTSVRLEGMGPKLLVSDLSTLDQPLLRWRMELKGNNAVEFGVVPTSLQENHKALHKCPAGLDGDRPAGFCSSITVGSQLPMKLPLMKGSKIEIMARSNLVEFIVTNPEDGMEMHWHNSVTVPKPYKGPRSFRFEQDLQAQHPFKLAVTCWARAAFDVLHF